MAIIYGRINRGKQFLEKNPKKIQNIEDIDRTHQEIRKNIKAHLEDGLFADKSKASKKQETKKSKDTSRYEDSSKEMQTSDILSQLSDDYHILCGVNLQLPNSVTYHKKKDLNSAKLDLIIVSKRGVVLLKDDYENIQGDKNENFSLHEQVDRSARVLRIALKSWRNPRNPSVKSIVLATKGNIQFDPKYKFVSVIDLDEINSFLKNKKMEFSEKDVKRIIDRLKSYVT